MPKSNWLLYLDRLDSERLALQAELRANGVEHGFPTLLGYLFELMLSDEKKERLILALEKDVLRCRAALAKVKETGPAGPPLGPPSASSLNSDIEALIKKGTQEGNSEEN